MQQSILLIAGNYFPEPTGIGKYNGEMIDWLSENGYDCTVITTFPYYPQWKVQEPYTKAAYWFKKEIRSTSQASSRPIKILRCPHYVPKTPTGLKRLLAEVSILFSTSVALLPFIFSNRFDFVMVVSPPFQLGLLGVLYNKLKGAKLLYHVQDLQIDAAKNLKMVKSNILINIMLAAEKYILKRANFISTISFGMIKKVEEKCGKDIIFFPNWVDTESFFPLPERELLKTRYGFSACDKVVLYSGAIGEKQGLEMIIAAAEHFRHNPTLNFVISGSGPYKDSLIHLTETAGLKNVTFLPLQPHVEFNVFLNMADVHLVLQKAHAADLVLPSKLSAILSVGGLVIVSANEGTSLHQIVSAELLGILISPEDQRALNEAIFSASTNENSHSRNNARVYARRNLSKNNIIKKYSEQVLNESKQNSSKRDKPKNSLALI